MKNNVLAHIQSVAPKISETVEVCLSSNKVNAVNAALASAKEQTAAAIASVLEHPNKRSLSSTRKSLVAIDNLLGGLMHGLETRELKVKEFRAVCSNLKTSFIPKLETSISEEVDKFKAESGADATQEEKELTPEQQKIRDALLTSESAMTGKYENGQQFDYDKEQLTIEQEDEKRRNQLASITGDVERRLARLRSLISVVPKRMTAPYSILKLPVAPHFETQAAVNPVVLDKLAIPHTEIPLSGLRRDSGGGSVRMERYVIFEQQTILLISKSHIESVLNQKQEDIADENSEEFKAIRVRRKKLKAQIEEAEKGVGIAKAKFDELSKQANESENIQAQIAEHQEAINKALESSYTKEDKALLQQQKTLDREIISVMQAAEKRADLYRKGTEPKAPVTKEMSDRERAAVIQAHKEDLLIPYQVRYERDMKVFDDKLADLKAQHKKVSVLVRRMTKQYVKNAAMTRKMELIAKLEVRLNAALTKETERNRLVSDAERRIVNLHEQLAKLEEDSKVKRRVVKRAGPPITPEDYARSVLSVINERTHNHYDLVSTKAAPNPRISSNAQDILFFWIMPVQKLSALSRLTGGKTKVMQWDFPFERERHESDDESTSSEAKGWVHLKDRDPTSLSREDLLEFLEYPQNAKYRPQGWTSRYKAVRRPQD